MNAQEKLSQLVDEVRALQDQVEAPNRDEEFQRLQCERNQAVRERDQAIKELADTKAAVEWLMGKILIKDLFGTNSTDIPSAAEGWLPMTYNPRDTERLEWINKNGRTGINQGNDFIIVLPSKISTEETIPEIYNIRDIIDLCRKS